MPERPTLQAAATSRPATAGATPRRKACICLFVRKRRNDEPAAIVIKNDGRKTQMVANNAPMVPATRNPPNVAMIKTVLVKVVHFVWLRYNGLAHLSQTFFGHRFR